ncbi:MAG: sensor histidine kinase [Candidatus Aenigmarchaeota archaeon]|nr:sensor histidine kinase [Candidatus Aenigmarchaeota archaeon]
MADDQTTVNQVVGKLLREAYDFEGNSVDFTGKSVGIGKFREDVIGKYPVIFDLDLDIPVTSLRGAKAGGLEFGMCEVLENAVAAYAKNSLDGGVRIRAYSNDQYYVLEVQDLAGGIPSEVMSFVNRDSTVAISKKRESSSLKAGGKGYKWIKQIAKTMDAQLDIDVNEPYGRRGTKVTLFVPKQ